MAITGFAGYGRAESLLGANPWVQHTFLAIGDAQEVRAGLLAVAVRTGAALETLPSSAIAPRIRNLVSCRNSQKTWPLRTGSTAS